VSLAVVELPKEVPNGTRTVFTTPSVYATGTVRVIRNGQWQTEGLSDGWTELGGDKVRLNEAPKVGDVIMIFYLRP